MNITSQIYAIADQHEQEFQTMQSLDQSVDLADSLIDEIDALLAEIEQESE
jgi:hypothetical protein